MQAYILDPSMDEPSRRRILDNFATVAMVRSKEKRTILKAGDDKRSHRQNRFYWKSLSFVVNHMRDHFDLDHKAEVWHELFKGKFAVPKVTEVNGETVKIYRSTTDMTMKEFSDYMERIAAYVSMEWGCVLPPAEQGY